MVVERARIGLLSTEYEYEPDYESSSLAFCYLMYI